jgi:tripartite-type tricarboxylate transporter receptor subunit TctC
VGTLLAGAGGAAAQPGYPNKPIRIITPYASGSSVDAVARIVGTKLSEALGQPALVEPRPGANTIIGSEAMVKSAPDGYTFLLISTTHVLNGLLIPNLPYDTTRDFAPVATIASSELILVASPKLAASSIKELVALGRSKQLSYATSSAGGPTHLAAELFSSMTGIKLTHIPYKGSGPAVTDLLGSHVDIGWTSPLAVIPHINAGKLKAIAISGDSRAPSLPNVPTFTESGLPGFEMRFWYGLLAPAATPKSVVERMNAVINQALDQADVKARLATLSCDPAPGTPEAFAQRVNADVARWKKLASERNIRAD